jgi:hypothetical protein
MRAERGSSSWRLLEASSMPFHSSPRIVAAVKGALLSAAFLFPGAPGLAQDAPFSGLEGSWIGNGAITTTNGRSERIRRRAKYFAAPSGHKSRSAIALCERHLSLRRRERSRSPIEWRHRGRMDGDEPQGERQRQGAAGGRYDRGENHGTGLHRGYDGRHPWRRPAGRDHPERLGRHVGCDGYASGVRSSDLPPRQIVQPSTP